MNAAVLYTGRHLRRRARGEGGFGMIELLAAMTVMLIGIFAVFSVFQAGIVQIRRASTITTAGAIADSEMENYRAIKYDSIGLSNTDVDTVVSGSYGATYTGQAYYKTDTAASTTLSAGITSASQLTVPVQASVSGFPSTGPFLVKIDSEIMLINTRTTSTWTINQTSDRGLFGTTAATHSSGATVYWVQRVNVAACGTAPCTSSVPTKTVTGADGRSYKVDTYITWLQITSAGATAGRLVKLVTIVVRNSASPYQVYAKLSASFDQGTGT
jgi:type II secretory pathway pseudopilin PulG